MVKKYIQAWERSVAIGRSAVVAVHEFLNSDAATQHWYPVKLIYPVEENPHYQKLEIDLRLIVSENGVLRDSSIEVKGDKNDKTGNFFIETVSDVARETGGAFLVCKAEWYFYYFLNSKNLYVMPMRTARSWFLKNQVRFPERTSHSSRGEHNWSTIGRLVPIELMKAEVEGLEQFARTGRGWVLQD